MELKEFVRMAFGYYSQIGESPIKEREIDQDFEDYWNDEDTQQQLKILNIPVVSNNEALESSSDGVAVCTENKLVPCYHRNDDNTCSFKRECRHKQTDC